MSNWKMNIIDGKSYLLLEVIVRKVKGSWNSSERDRKSHYLPEGNHWRSLFLLRDRHGGVIIY